MSRTLEQLHEALAELAANLDDLADELQELAAFVNGLRGIHEPAPKPKHATEERLRCVD